MPKQREVYKCEVCGIIIEVTHSGAGNLVCCNKHMILLEEKTEDSSTEKHVPFIERKNDRYIVKVGQNTEHPMGNNHYIEWIELEVDGIIYKKYLTPNDKPEAEFIIPEGKSVSAREFCNIHGVWKSN